MYGDDVDFVIVDATSIQTIKGLPINCSVDTLLNFKVGDGQYFFSFNHQARRITLHNSKLEPFGIQVSSDLLRFGLGLPDTIPVGEYYSSHLGTLVFKNRAVLYK